MTTIEGGRYLSTDGKTYHDANGNPVAGPATGPRPGPAQAITITEQARLDAEQARYQPLLPQAGTAAPSSSSGQALVAETERRAKTAQRN